MAVPWDAEGKIESVSWSDCTQREHPVFYKYRTGPVQLAYVPITWSMLVIATAVCIDGPISWWLLSSRSRRPRNTTLNLIYLFARREFILIIIWMIKIIYIFILIKYFFEVLDIVVLKLRCQKGVGKLQETPVFFVFVGTHAAHVLRYPSLPLKFIL